MLFFACIETGANSRQVPSVSEAPKVLLPRSVSAERRRGRGGGPFFFAGGISSAEASVIAFSTFAPIFLATEEEERLKEFSLSFPPTLRATEGEGEGELLKKVLRPSRSTLNEA